MKRLFSHLFICLFVYLFIVFGVIGLFAAPPVFAQENYVDSDYPGCIKDATENGALCIGANASTVQTSVMSDLVRRILGPVRGVTITMDETDEGYIRRMAQGSAVRGISNYIAMMYQYPAADFGLWLADTGRTLGFLPTQVYAQGVGFTGLQPLLGIWKAFRNIAYLILALFMIVIGFMVMFRKKIDPKTVVTVQNALPRVVITLLLITFSYAIVGLMIDLMYLLILVVAAVFAQAGLIKITPETTSALLGGNLSGLFSLIFPNGAITLGQLLLSMMGPTVTGVSAAVGALVGIVVTGAITPLSWLGAAAGAAIGAAVPTVLITLLVSLFLLFAYIRLFFTLFGAFIQIILALLFGPLQLLLEAVPGGEGFGPWIKNLFANLLAFPITAAMFLLSFSFSSMVLKNPTSTIWTPPFLWGSGASSDAIAGFFSLGILFSVPSIIGSIKETLKAKPAIPMQFGVAGGAGFMQWISAAYYVKELAPQGLWGRIFEEKQSSSPH